MLWELRHKSRVIGQTKTATAAYQLMLDYTHDQMHLHDWDDTEADAYEKACTIRGEGFELYSWYVLEDDKFNEWCDRFQWVFDEIFASKSHPGKGMYRWWFTNYTLGEGESFGFAPTLDKIVSEVKQRDDARPYRNTRILDMHHASKHHFITGCRVQESKFNRSANP